MHLLNLQKNKNFHSGEDKNVLISIINLNDLRRFNRLDAEYYQPQYLEYLSILNKLQPVRLGNHAKVTDGIHTSIDYDIDSNIRCLSAQSVKEGFINTTANSFISKEQHMKNSKTNLKEGDIILSSVGTIGNCSVVTKDVLPSNADRHVGIIRVEKELNPYFVSAFLNSKYGYFQSIREATGNVQLNLFIDKMNEILIPITSIQDEIGKMVKHAIDKYFETKEKLNNAESILLSHMKLHGLILPEKLSYIHSYHDVINSGRFDPEYFQPKYDVLLSIINKFNPIKLSNLGTPVTKKVKFDQNKSYKYIEISDVDISIGEVGYTSRDYNDLPANAKISVHGGEFIISKVRPTRGAIGIIPIDCAKDSICSNAFSIYDIKSPMREYLQIVLRTIIGKIQLEKPTKGTSYPTVDDIDIANIMIPQISNNSIEEISTIVNNAFKIRKEAKKLMKKAIKTVEIFIENGESKAMEFFNTV